MLMFVSFCNIRKKQVKDAAIECKMHHARLCSTSVCIDIQVLVQKQKDIQGFFEMCIGSEILSIMYTWMESQTHSKEQDVE